jgi:23S rRNA (uracil1939-C5)-methyltransferase
MVAAGSRVGLYGKDGSHDVVDTPMCVVLSPALSSVVANLRERIARDEEAGGPLAPRVSQEQGGLTAIDVREVRTGEDVRVLVTWVVAPGRRVKLESLRAAAASLLQDMPVVHGVAVNLHDGHSPQVLGAETLLLAGQGWAKDEVGASVHRATVGSFVQAHRGQAARVHAAIADVVFAGRDRKPRVLDLYGGSGAIALGLASRGADVVMVESFGPACEQASLAARDAGVMMSVVSSDVGKALSALSRNARPFDVAVVNPPRRGLAPDVRTAISAMKPGAIVYVSCQPETLARDLEHLARLGYAAEGLAPLDMIPLTEEVETVVVLRASSPPSPVILYEDDEVVVVDKPPHEPVTPQGEHERSLLVRVQQRVRGSAEAVPVHRLDVGTSGVVIFAKRASVAGAWSRALQEGGEKVYLALVRGDPGERRTVTKPIPTGGQQKAARTDVERVNLFGAHALVRVVPHEGRRHQIRRHLAALGHPVLGDDRYGHAASNRFFLERHGLDRTFLHAARLSLEHPTRRRTLVVESTLPGDLLWVRQSLEAAR